MISAQADQVQQDILIEKYMMLPNQVKARRSNRCLLIDKSSIPFIKRDNSLPFQQVWDDIISQATKNVDILKDMGAVKQLGSILKTNVRACKALGHSYVSQLGRIYLDMLNVYKIMSENITQAISLNGLSINNQPLIKAMHVVKKETLTLISEWVWKSNDPKMVMENFIPPLLEAVLFDYQVSILDLAVLRTVHADDDGAFIL